jgi:transcriptional regulator with XRE-family HTH domain
MYPATEHASVRMTTQTSFSEWVKTERDRRGWTQQVLADQADTTKATISRYETGERTPHEESTLHRIADALAGPDADEETRARLRSEARAAAAGLLPTDPRADCLKLMTPSGYGDVPDHIHQAAAEKALEMFQLSYRSNVEMLSGITERERAVRAAPDPALGSPVPAKPTDDRMRAIFPGLPKDGEQGKEEKG